MKNLFSNIAPSSMAKCEEGKSLSTASKYSPQNYVFYRTEIHVTETVKGALLASIFYLLSGLCPCGSSNFAHIKSQYVM